MSEGRQATRAAARRIGLLGEGFVDWMGGVSLLQVIARGLLAQDAVRPPLQLLYPVATAGDESQARWRLVGEGLLTALGSSRFAGRSRSAPDPAQVVNWFGGAADGIELVAHGRDRSDLEAAARARQVDVILPAFRSLGPRFAVPWVGYIFDFQYRYYPQYFGARERMGRQLWFGRMLRDAAVVIVNARAVRDDVARFFPGRESKVVSLPFAPDTRPEWWDLDAEQARLRHALPERYFLICNQFWVHKDHETAIRALRLLHSDPAYRDVVLACTGKQEDYRAPGHFGRLQRLVAELRLEASVRFLGVLPKAEQMAIVRVAQAVVQPSLFEGGPGGGAANDSIAVGTPLIASDIAVNRELDLGAVSFFAASDPEALAQRMREALSRQERPSMDELRALSQSRRQLLGGCLLAAIDRAVTDGPGML